MTPAVATAAVLLLLTRALPRGVRREVRHRTRGGVDVSDVQALEQIARDLRTGAPLPIAIAGARRRVLVSVVAAMRRDAPVTAALSTARPRDASERLVVQTLHACARAGGEMASTVERGITILRERIAFERDRAVHSAQARASATVMTVVPVVFAAFSYATSTRVRDAYASTAVTTVLAALGLALNLLGWLWMRRLVGRRA